MPVVLLLLLLPSANTLTSRRLHGVHDDDVQKERGRESAVE
jgi:hypothetical protein